MVQITVFLGVTPNAAVADGFVEARSSDEALSRHVDSLAGLGDGRAYKTRRGADALAGFLHVGYVFRVGTVGVLVGAAGLQEQEQAVDAQARQFAGLQQAGAAVVTLSLLTLP